MAQGQRQDLLLRRLGAIEHADNRAAAHHCDAVAHAEDLRQLGRDHQDGQPARGQLAHQPMNLGLGADVDALCWLVEDQDRGFGRQPAGEGDLLLIAARQVADRRLDRRRLDRRVARP